MLCLSYNMLNNIVLFLMKNCDLIICILVYIYCLYFYMYIIFIYMWSFRLCFVNWNLLYIVINGIVLFYEVKVVMFKEGR